MLRHGAAEILIDPGTYTYVGDLRERDAFRGSAAHNTVRIDAGDQADPAGPFRWLNKPQVKVLQWHSTAEQDYLHAACSYRSLRHRREVWFNKPDLMVVVDTIEGAGEHDIEQFWHAGDTVTPVGNGRWRIGTTELAINGEGSVIEGWRSDSLGSKRDAPVIRVAARASLPFRLATVIRIGGQAPTPVIDGSDRVVVNGAVYAK